MYPTYKEHLNILSNKIENYKGIIQTYIAIISGQKINAQRLAALLQKEYHVK